MSERVGARPVDINTLLADKPELANLFVQIQDIYDRFDRGELTPAEADIALTAAGLTDELEEADPTLDNKSFHSIFMENRRQGLRVVAPEATDEPLEEPPVLPSQLAA